MTDNHIATVSLCMIVKDEESCLGRCLDSVKDEVDEIVIVDTGSRDGTVELARRYTDRVYFHPWEDSFSKARNQALAYPKGDWVFQLDADEELDARSKGLLQGAVRNTTADAFNVGILCFTDQGRSSSFHRFPRLFLNNGRIHYQGIVHNQVVNYKHLIDSDIMLLHHGYNLDDASKLKKFERTVPLLFEQIKRNPKDPSPYINLSTSFLSMNLLEKALDASTRAIALMGRLNRYPNLGSVAFYNRAICLFHRNAFPEMASAGLECRRRYPNDIDSGLVMVFAYRGLQQWDDVIRYGKDYLTRVQNLDVVGSRVIMSLAETWKAHLFTGEAYLHKKNREKAVKHFHEALAFTNQRETCLNAVIRILLDRGSLAEARPFVDSALQEDLCRDAVNLYKDRTAPPARPAAPGSGHGRRTDLLDGAGDRPAVSLCMIVRNESECIRQCLESVRPLLEEIVVVDTGSTDPTTDIAREFGAGIHPFPWTGDFSEARNFALSKVKGEWTLVMDADEVIAPKDLERIRDLIRNGGADAYRLTLRNYVKDPNLANAVPNRKDDPEGLQYPAYIPVPLVRLFRTDPAIRYGGRVHETLDASLAETGKRVVDSGIPIHHYGKVMPSRIRKKQESYRTLGIDKTLENPEDPSAYKTLADQCLEMDLADQALACVEEGLRRFPDFSELHFDKGLALERSGRPLEAERAYRETVRGDPLHVGALNNLAGILLRQGNHQEALNILQGPSVRHLNHPVIQYTIGLVYSALDHHGQALKHFDKALELSPGFKKVNIQKALVFLKGNEFGKAAECLNREIENGGDIIPAYITLGEISLRLEDFQNAVHSFQKVLSLDPDNQSARDSLRRLSKMPAKSAHP